MRGSMGRGFLPFEWALLLVRDLVSEVGNDGGVEDVVHPGARSVPGRLYETDERASLANSSDDRIHTSSGGSRGG